MKTLASLLLISATFAGATAYAQDSQAESLTRAQVVAELQAAKAAGLVSFGDLDYPPALTHNSSASRSQVVAELRAAKVAGQVTYGDLDYPPVNAVADSTLTREQVHAEVVAIHKNGPVAFGGEGYPNTGA